MKRKAIFLVLSFFLLLSTAAALTRQKPVAAQGPYTIALTTGFGIGTKAVTDMDTWLTGLGHTLKVTSGEINASFLTDVDALLVGGFYGPITGIEETNSTNWPALITPITDWFATGGGKFLWVGSDSDYQGRNWIADNSSAILEAVGSALRAEPSDITELKTVWDDGVAHYRPSVNITAPNPVSEALMAGVNGSLFHGPTCLYGVLNDNPVALEDTDIPNVYPIGLVHEYSRYEPDDPTVPGYAHEVNDPGPFVMIAGQVGLGPAFDNKVVASGSTPYGGYEPIWKDSYHGLTLNGSGLVKNCILWGLTYEAFPPGIDPMLLLIAGAAVVIIIVIVVVVIFLRRR